MQAQHLITLQPKPALRDEQTIAVSDTLPLHRTPRNARQNLLGGFNPSEKYESELVLLFPTEWENQSHVPVTTNQVWTMTKHH